MQNQFVQIKVLILLYQKKYKHLPKHFTQIMTVILRGLGKMTPSTFGLKSKIMVKIKLYIFGILRSPSIILAMFDPQLYR